MQDVTESLNRSVAVVPSDTVPIAFAGGLPIPSFARRLFVGTGGTVKVLTLGGDTVTYTVPTGGYVRMNVTQVFSTGTSAALIVAEY